MATNSLQLAWVLELAVHGVVSPELMVLQKPFFSPACLFLFEKLFELHDQLFRIMFIEFLIILAQMRNFFLRVWHLSSNHNLQLDSQDDASWFAETLVLNLSNDRSINCTQTQSYISRCRPRVNRALHIQEWRSA